MPPETTTRDIFDQCRVWESVRRASKPGLTQTFPTYMVSDSDRERDELRVVAVTAHQSPPFETLLRRLLVDVDVLAPAPKPEPLTVEQLLQCLLAGSQARQPVPVPATGNSDLETLLCEVCFPGIQHQRRDLDWV